VTARCILATDFGEGLFAVFVIAAVPLGAGMWLWSRARASAMLDRWALRHGVRLVSAEHRSLFRGPFFWTTGRGQLVYRIAVRYPDGTVRVGWARLGGWLLGLLVDVVDVRWDAHDPCTTAPGGFPVVMPTRPPDDRPPG
jgi:hypothetical protein